MENADILTAYAAMAFEYLPGFLQMIEWLELHVRAELFNIEDHLLP
jgi:hypothetical protein